MPKVNNTTVYPVTTPAANDRIPGIDVSNTSNSPDGEIVQFTLSAVLGLTHTHTKAQITDIEDLERIGVGQTWQTVSRAAGVTYQNTTGRAIMVAIASIANSAGTIQMSVSGTFGDAIYLAYTTNDRFHPDSNQFIVPANHYYRLVSGASLLIWSELR